MAKDQFKIIILFKECLRPAKKYRISHHKIVESDESAAKISLVVKDKIGISARKLSGILCVHIAAALRGLKDSFFYDSVKVIWGL